MQAVILAAGMGRRLGEFTADNTKCMLEVNGERLIDRTLAILSRLDLSQIVIVVGYKGDNLRKAVEGKWKDLNVVWVENEVYAKTNNIYSFWLAKPHLLDEATLLLESDLIYDGEVVDLAVAAPYPDCALVAKYEAWMDGTMVTLDSNDNIVNFIPKSAFDYADTASYYKTVNIYKFSHKFLKEVYWPFLEAYIKVMGENEYYEQVLRVVTLIDRAELKGVDITGHKWYEIDDVQDLNIAETIFARPEVKLKKLQQCYGGYWRYGELKDFCYLVNPYFPSRRMMDELKANFEQLLTQYPSGMGVNSMLAGKYTGLPSKMIIPGNGAAELIKALMEGTQGKVGVVYPTFEEYPNRLDPEMIEVFRPRREDFRYTAADLMERFSGTGIEKLLVVNPDNPSGNYLGREEIEELARWGEKEGVRLIIDESFVDFSEDEDPTLLRRDFLERHPGVCVMKSISKSYGVPGLRLGVLASADEELIGRLKRDVAIWNINSFAEFYMQIFNKYERDYAQARRRFRKERAELRAALEASGVVRPMPSQANYFLCEVLPPWTAPELTKVLLNDFNILIKDCSGKKGLAGEGELVRIAVRDRADNRALAEALAKLKK